MSEAEFYFLEQNYDSSVYYFEEGFKHVEETHPRMSLNYAEALWHLERKILAKQILSNKNIGVFSIDSTRFNGISSVAINQINTDIGLNISKSDKYTLSNNFIDSLQSIDRNTRINYGQIMDSLSYIEPYPKKVIDSIGPILWEKVEFIDSINGEALIQFTLKNGFPGGKNIGWNTTASALLLHMDSSWYIEHYPLLLNEVVKGNLEPWMLAAGVDRQFVIETEDEIFSPNNQYWSESATNPFLLFNNCVSIGASPYYQYWGMIERSKNYDYYKQNKRYFNTTSNYTHNNTYTPLLKSRFE